MLLAFLSFREGIGLKSCLRDWQSTVACTRATLKSPKSPFSCFRRSVVRSPRNRSQKQIWKSPPIGRKIRRTRHTEIGENRRSRLMGGSGASCSHNNAFLADLHSKQKVLSWIQLSTFAPGWEPTPSIQAKQHWGPYVVAENWKKVDGRQAGWLGDVFFRNRGREAPFRSPPFNQFPFASLGQRPFCPGEKRRININFLLWLTSRWPWDKRLVVPGLTGPKSLCVRLETQEI